MANIQSSYQEARLPFAKMTYTPDVPSTALGPNEYNSGLNVETDVRGIRSTAGDQEFLNTITGTPTYVSSGFRQNGTFWFIVATVEGKWWAASDTTTWYDITPPQGVGTYAQNTNITEAWNGTIPFFNDAQNPPMFLPDTPGAVLTMYSNTLPISINNIVRISASVQQIQFTSIASAPYSPGEQIVLTGCGNYYNGTFTVVSSTTTTINYTASPNGGLLLSDGALVSPLYCWNYNPNWLSYYANFLRIYNTPNVGSILVAGNLTVTDDTSTQTNYPVTVQWSQAFGLNQAPTSWQPTVTNVANQLEVPLRGPALDAFPSNGNFFLCSYWDTVVFSPLNYSTTSAPILGVRLYNQGRGLLSSNTWANTDKLVYGIDARDIWVFDGNDFQGIGNQRVKNWFYDQLAPQYYDRVFMETNTEKNQIEIYYPDSNAVNGVPNKMLAYRYDLDCWNAPRDVASATMGCEAPVYTYSSGSWHANYGSRTIVYARGVTNQKLVQKDIGYSFIANVANPTGAITSSFRRDNIKLLKDYSGKLMVHRILPEVVNIGSVPFTGTYNIPIIPSTGNLTVTIEGSNSVGSEPTVKTPVTIPIDANGDTNSQNPWAQINQNAFRVNTIELGDTSTTNTWMCSATTWQITQVEDDR